MESKVIDIKKFLDVLTDLGGEVGKVSDGYHTFDELYHHRMTLFACLCADNPNAWKSMLHDDGTMYENYFIVGINTRYGQATYHYHLDNWTNFKCKKLDYAPKWDGHTPEMAIKRLLQEYVNPKEDY
ncbi:MAG: hypothetical protein ACRDCW_14545 [Sarcina sp.]